MVENVRYVGSQCWPFPSQLMAGFTVSRTLALPSFSHALLAGRSRGEASLSHMSRLVGPGY